MSCCGQGRRVLARTRTQTLPARAASPGLAQVTTRAVTPAATANVIRLALGMARARRRPSAPQRASRTSHINQQRM
jgi:hypothetical protein